MFKYLNNIYIYYPRFGHNQEKHLITLKHFKMRKLAFISAIILTISCSKVSTTKIDSESPEVYVEDGVLVFKNPDVFSNTLKQLNKQTDKEKETWEKTIGFYSFRSAYSFLVNEISLLDSEKELNDLLNKNSKFVKKQGDIIVPLVDNFFSSIVNEEGIVKIGNDYYRFYDGKETIVLNGSKSKLFDSYNTNLTDSKNGIFSFRLSDKANAVIQARYTCNSGVMSECAIYGSNRRSYHKLEYSYYFTILRDPVTALPTYNRQESFVDLHFSGTKKVLGVWVTYSTSFDCFDLLYTDNEGVNISLPYLGSGGDYKDWYYNLSTRIQQTPYGQAYVSIQCSPDISLFTCRGSSRGTSPASCTFTY